LSTYAIKLKNSGDVNLHLSFLSTFVDPESFSVSLPEPFTLRPRQHLQVMVGLKPLKTGLFSVKVGWKSRETTGFVLFNGFSEDLKLSAGLAVTLEEERLPSTFLSPIQHSIMSSDGVELWLMHLLSLGSMTTRAFFELNHISYQRSLTASRPRTAPSIDDFIESVLQPRTASSGSTNTTKDNVMVTSTGPGLYTEEEAILKAGHVRLQQYMEQYRQHDATTTDQYDEIVASAQKLVNLSIFHQIRSN